MHVSRLRALCIEIYKTMKQLNPVFMHDIFSFKSSTNLSRSQRNPHDLLHHRPNQTNIYTNSLRALGPKIWNGLSNEMKSSQNIFVFKRLIKQWDGVECSCNACQFEKHNINQKSIKKKSLNLYYQNSVASKSLLYLYCRLIIIFYCKYFRI